MDRYTGWGRAVLLAGVGLCLAPVACEQPVVGEKAVVAAPSGGPRLVVEDGWIDLHGHAVATFSVSQDDVPLALPEVIALDPRFTLATLTSHPVDGIRAWKSQVLTGLQKAVNLPASGPGTDPAFITSDAQQPGSEAPATLVDLGEGRFRYVFVTALSTLDPDETVRVGAWLQGAPSPSLRTSSTYDFRPSGGPVEERDTVADASCNRCHANLVRHGTRAGVRLCIACHTWLNSDPDTIDPAALVTAAVTKKTDPNPLELGRMVHRIHRGSQLPTLYASSSRANPAPALASGNTLPLPFSPEINGTQSILGRRYSIVEQSGMLVPGWVVTRTDNGQPAKTVVTGITFPRDVRDCAVCHGDPVKDPEHTPRQAYMVNTAISRRTCAGCHPDVWYQAEPSGPVALDESHFAHAGGPQGDDTACAGCHLQAVAGGKLYAPVDQLHVPHYLSARYSQPRLEIVKVENLQPGKRPRVTFKVTDRIGPVVPTLGNPVPAAEPDSATSSLVPRKLSSATIRIAGPAVPDYGGPNPLSVSSVSFDVLNLTTADPLTNEYVYAMPTVATTAPAGTWAVGMEARRRIKVAHYDKASDVFLWPYTGETVNEIAYNPIVYVDSATGTWPPDAASQRRVVVASQNCERCHSPFSYPHGGTRNQVHYCLFCHTNTLTEWSRRTKNSAGAVDLAASFDGIEERTLHLKVMVMRIHTGAREGSASLEGISPFVMAGSFFGLAEFPSDLRNCTLCHVGNAFKVDSVPPDARPTQANESASTLHEAATSKHPPGEPATLPIRAACTACHATGATFAHVASKTVDGVESCPKCHAKGPLAGEVVHGLVAPSGTVPASFAAIRDRILVPRCASTACHGEGAPYLPRPLDDAGAYGALVDVPSSVGLSQVKPGAPEASYLVYKLRGTHVSVGGSGALMPTDGALAPADVAAVEAWIASGAPNN